VQSMVDECFKKVNFMFHTDDVRALVSREVHEALVNSQLLILCAAQDESTDPATVVRILNEGRTEIIDRFFDEEV
jgi:hypothetical protein